MRWNSKSETITDFRESQTIAKNSQCHYNTLNLVWKFRSKGFFLIHMQLTVKTLLTHHYCKQNILTWWLFGIRLEFGLWISTRAIRQELTWVSNQASKQDNNLEWMHNFMKTIRPKFFWFNKRKSPKSFVKWLQMQKSGYARHLSGEKWITMRQNWWVDGLKKQNR